MPLVLACVVIVLQAVILVVTLYGGYTEGAGYASSAGRALRTAWQVLWIVFGLLVLWLLLAAIRGAAKRVGRRRSS